MEIISLVYEILVIEEYLSMDKKFFNNFALFKNFSKNDYELTTQISYICKKNNKKKAFRIDSITYLKKIYYLDTHTIYINEINILIDIL